MPGDVRFGHVADAVGANGHVVISWKTRGDEKEFAVEDRGGNELFSWPVDLPKLSAVARVIAGDGLRAGDDHLTLAAGIDDERSAIRADAVAAVDAPLFLACGFVETDNEGFRVLIAVQDERVFFQDGRSAKAVSRIELARRL